VTPAELLRTIRDAPPETLSRWVGACAEGQALAWTRLLSPGAARGARASRVEPDDAGRCFSVRRTAERLGLDEGKVYALLRKGRLPGFKEGKHWLVPVRALDEYVHLSLDRSLYKSYIRANGRSRAPTDPRPAEADAGGDRRTPGSHLQHGGKMGARRGTDQRGDVQTGATHGPVGAEG